VCNYLFNPSLTHVPGDQCAAPTGTGGEEEDVNNPFCLPTDMSYIYISEEGV